MKRPKHVHFIGAGGVVTSALAAELQRHVARLTGSDERILPPADGYLKAAGLDVTDGFLPESVTDAIDLAIIAPAIKRGNPELEEVLRKRIPWTTWPSLLSKLDLLGGHTGVVAGTDGKSTTSCMWTWIMQKNGLDPDYVIGGRVPDWPHGVRLRKSAYCILEGDEYPTGLGDRNPKFVHYQPEVAILTNLHFDHPEAYTSEAEVMRSFHLLVDLLPPDGLLVYNGKDKRCCALAADARCSTLGIGTGRVDAPLQNIRHHVHGTDFTLLGCAFSIPQMGFMNAANAASAALAARHWGVSLMDSAQALQSFPGTVDRQTVLRHDERLVLMSDTAYHPNAVGHLMDAVAKHHPGRRLCLVLHPRHTHGPQNWQQKLWKPTLLKADEVILMDAVNPSDTTSLFSSVQAAESGNLAGGRITRTEDAAATIEKFKNALQDGDVWVLCLAAWFKEPRESITAHGLNF